MLRIQELRADAGRPRRAAGGAERALASKFVARTLRSAG